MAHPTPLLAVPLCLLFACSLTGQRGHHGGGGGFSGGHSGGHSGGFSGGHSGGFSGGHSAPSHGGSFSAPMSHPSAPSPTPHFSNPTPHFGSSTPGYSAPAPQIRHNPTPTTHFNPSVATPRTVTPSPNLGARSHTPSVTVHAPTHTPTPSVGNLGHTVTRPSAAPMVTTRGDARPAPSLGHYPSAGVRTTPGTIHRAGATTATPVPSTHVRSGAPASVGTVHRQPSAVAANRYASTHTPAPVSTARPSSGTGAHLTPRSTATPAPAPLARGSSAVAVPRHGSGVATAPTLGHAGSPRATHAASGSLAPHLTPRIASPSLGVPRAAHSPAGTRLVQPIANTYGAPRYTWGRSHHCGTVWNSWWNPYGYGYGYGYGSYGYGTPYSYGGYGYGYGPYGYWGGYGGLTYYSNWGSFGFGFNLWQPYWAWRNYYWNSCYSSAWWNTWSRPYYLSSSYWWYPRTVYCPTYLYVPNTVYEPTTVNVPTTVVYATGSVAPTVAAGGSVVGTARTTELPADAGSADMATSLAIKYVDLGDFYFRAGRFDDAVEAYGKARSYAPNDASVHFVLADASFANGDYHYAAFLIAEAVRLDPNIVSATTDKRTFYGDAKAFDAQMAALDAYLAKQPYDAMAHLVRAYNLRFSGQPDAAKKAFERVLEIDPDHRAARAFVEALAPKDR